MASYARIPALPSVAEAAIAGSGGGGAVVPWSATVRRVKIGSDHGGR